jgi:bifunctional non-homologous end joining protein LigD
MSLKEYKKKRDFKKTSEPGETKTKKKSEGLIYAIQEHDASHLHFDLRLLRKRE